MEEGLLSVLGSVERHVKGAGVRLVASFAVVVVFYLLFFSFFLFCLVPRGWGVLRINFQQTIPEFV